MYLIALLTLIASVSPAPLTQNETAVLLYVVCGLLGIVAILIAAMWNMMAGKVDKQGTTLQVILTNQGIQTSDIQHIQKETDKIHERLDQHDDRIRAVERIGGLSHG